jgi:hypothetical protein
MTALHIGCAAGFSGDRVDAAAPVVRTLIDLGGPAFLVYETLAERTLALAQLSRRGNPEGGYEPRLDALLRPVLGDCLRHGIRIVGNFGAANPEGAAARIAALARELGLTVPRIAVIRGDDLSGPEYRPLLRSQIGSAFDDLEVLCANAYIGADSLVEALDAGAQVVVAGRIADPTLAVAPARAHFGWRHDDWQRIARATMAGHLLECGAQVTGGYFADPGYKEVPGLASVGFPVARIEADGNCVIGKASGTGGVVNLQTVKEQLLYEVHDPAAYLTPDVVADLSTAELGQSGTDQVALRGVSGHPRPADLKVNVFHAGGWLAEGEISYAGHGAERRARLAAGILQQRLAGLRLRIDLIGVLSILGDDDGRLLEATPAGAARDVRLRVAAAHDDREQADRLVHEVNGLYTCGPAGGGGVRTGVRARLNTLSCLVPRERVNTSYRFYE